MTNSARGLSFKISVHSVLSLFQSLISAYAPKYIGKALRAITVAVSSKLAHA